MEEVKKNWRPFWSYKYTPEELLKEAMEYFAYCDKTKMLNWYGKEVWKPKTLTWLAKWLWVDKSYISDKLNNDSYSGMIKYIRNQVENDIEEKAMLWVYNPTVANKNLRANFGRRDRIETESKTIIISNDEQDILNQIL
jgi:hypothetical protein